MANETWLLLNSAEQSLIAEALTTYQAVKPDNHMITALALRVGNSNPILNITVGVSGGQVQWVLGNTVPIRICDYDGQNDDLPDIDERGQRCRMWSM
jgi:hypothetical protein